MTDINRPAEQRTALDAALDTLDDVTRDWTESAQRAKTLEVALRNCLYLSARHKFEGDWAHIERFCANVGIALSPLRSEKCVCGAGVSRPHIQPCPFAEEPTDG